MLETLQEGSRLLFISPQVSSFILPLFPKFPKFSLFCSNYVYPFNSPAIICILNFYLVINLVLLEYIFCVCLIHSFPQFVYLIIFITSISQIFSFRRLWTQRCCRAFNSNWSQCPCQRWRRTHSTSQCLLIWTCWSRPTITQCWSWP